MMKMTELGRLLLVIAAKGDKLLNNIDDDSLRDDLWALRLTIDKKSITNTQFVVLTGLITVICDKHDSLQLDKFRKQAGQMQYN